MMNEILTLKDCVTYLFWTRSWRRNHRSHHLNFLRFCRFRFPVLLFLKRLLLLSFLYCDYKIRLIWNLQFYIVNVFLSSLPVCAILRSCLPFPIDCKWLSKMVSSSPVSILKRCLRVKTSQTIILFMNATIKYCSLISICSISCLN